MIKKSLKGCLVSVVGLAAIITSSSVYAANTDVVVALDPGHGGGDPGASAGGLIESDLTWKIATRVKAILDRTSGITGVLTKKESENLNREQRTINAQNNNADLLVSFHINSSEGSNRLSGAEVYVTHSRAQKRYYEYSSILGNDILNNLRNVGVRSYSSTPKVRIGSEDDKYSDGTIADYYGIISWPIHKDIPAVLVEHAFINNPYDRANYLNDSMLTKMAEADANAIIKNKELFRRNYYGNINTSLVDLKQINNAAGEGYLSGFIDIAEWVGSDCRTPSGTPELTLKSTDGKVSKKMYVSYQEGIRYYFDTNIEKLDMNKEYYIEAKLTGSKNTAPDNKKVQRVSIPNKTLNNNYKNRILKITNNKIVFSEGEYTGDIKTTIQEVNAIKGGNGDKYISGLIKIEEIVNGTSRTPRSLPEIRIKSTDGKVNNTTYISYQDGTKYYFDKDIQNFDTSKEYYIEVSLTTEDNISKNKTEKLAFGNGSISSFDDMEIIAKNDNLLFTYKGNINTDLYKMQIIQNGAGENYISGRINIAEWVNNECRAPSTTPKMTLKSSDGKIAKTVYISLINGIEYYYDVNIQNLDDTKEYYLEVELTNPNNTADSIKKIQTAKIAQNGEIGITTNDYKIMVNKNIVTMQDKGKYYGNINTELYKVNVIQTGAGLDYITGNIYIAEWVNNECRTPSTTPKMTLKSTDGTFATGMYVSQIDGINYYFDKCIKGIDESKEYYIEVELTNKKNTAPETNKKQTAKVKQQGKIGTCKNGDRVVVKGNNIKIEADTYKGNINTELYRINVIQTGAGLDYITGNIYIAEWVNNECRTPSATPKMTLKSTDGTFKTEMYVSQIDGINYYFDKCINGIDKSKEYYIEVELTGKNNISAEVNKKQTAKVKPQGEIGTLKSGDIVKTSRNNIKIEVKTSIKKIQRSVQEEKKAVVENKEETDTKQNENKENTENAGSINNTEKTKQLDTIEQEESKIETTVNTSNEIK